MGGVGVERLLGRVLCHWARGLVRRLAPTEPALRTEAIGDLWQWSGVVVQRANALRVLALAGH